MEGWDGGGPSNSQDSEQDTNSNQMKNSFNKKQLSHFNKRYKKIALDNLNSKFSDPDIGHWPPDNGSEINTGFIHPHGDAPLPLLSLDNRELYQKLYEEKLNDSEHYVGTKIPRLI